VLGRRAKEVQSYIERVYKGKTKLRFVYNADYELSNGLSVLCAKKIVHGEFVLTMADHILDDQIMMMVRNHRPLESGAVLCVDYKIDSIFDLDDATKVLESEGKIKKIGKELEVFNCIDTGVFICTPDLMQALEEIYLLNGDVSLTEAIQLLAKRSEMSVLDIGDAFWQDIDTVEMLDHARHMLRKKNCE
jgi:choline kinase